MPCDLIYVCMRQSIQSRVMSSFLQTPRPLAHTHIYIHIHLPQPTLQRRSHSFMVRSKLEVAKRLGEWFAKREMLMWSSWMPA